RLLDILCTVCGDRSSGKHYGTYSCDGCSGFFKRSIHENRKYVCKEQGALKGRCPINKKLRNQCRACRLAMCFKAKMNRDAVQHVRGPRKPKPHSMISEKQQSPIDSSDRLRTGPGSGYVLLPSRPVGLVQKPPEDSQSPVPLALSHSPSTTTLYSAPPSVTLPPQPLLQILMSAEKCQETTARLLFMAVRWFRSLPPIQTLSENDQLVLLEGSWTQLFLLHLAQWFMPCNITELLADEQIRERLSKDKAATNQDLITIQNICQQALETKCSLFIQRAASNAFNKLIDLLKEYEMELGETIKRFVSLFPIVDIKERSVLFLVIGEITKHNPEIPEVKEYSTMIFQQLRNDIIKQVYSDIFQVYLDVLSNLLGELSCDLKQKYCKELYGWVKDLSRPERYQVKKVSMRSAVNLLSRHIYLFCEFVYCDYKHWYNLLVNLAQDKNLQCSECGQHALKSFYRMIGNTLKYKTSEEDKAVFLYFKNLLEEQLKSNQQANTNILRFIIYGFSQMAAPCKRYLTDNNVREMFSLIAHCAVPLYSREDLGRLMLESTCDYQEALSEIILHTSDLSIDQINIILKLSIILIKRFPDLPVTSRSSAISSLIHTIINVGIVSKTLLEEFLYNLIQDGIIWSCSHTLFIDAELQRGLQNLGERPVCYKNYLPLWLQLLKLERYKQHQQILQVVVDSMIHVSIVLISKLNLNTKTKEDNIFSDVAFSQIGENNEDFRMFVNIVDLYVDIISELESSLLINTLHKFLLKIIGMSYKRPLISGFYKLVYATFKHISNLLNDEIETETLELLYKYLMNILNLISTFSGELLTTCLSLILNVPEIYIKRILNSTIPTFKIALTVGLSDFEIAYTALNTLEKWTSHLNNRQTDKFLREIVPLLEPYLHSGESCVEFLQDIIKTERKVIKRVILRDDENTLERFQMRILLFIASLDTDIIMNFVYKRSMDTGATWDKKDLLKYSLMLSDTEVDVYFDKILPRLTQLAQNSGDRRTKIIACEVLHSVIVFIVGKTSTSNMNRFAPVYKIICPALLSLGCDLDEAASKIFHPLTLQLIHWLSSQFMLNSLATTYFVDSLFESLNNDSNSSLREFSGMCLAEFTKWSIKQSDNKKKIQLNIDGVIYKITNFALHPSVSKRVAAITAFNHLYIVLREDEEIVSEYWLELLYCFVKSLDGCNDPSIKTALEHVERVLIAKMNLLNAEDDKRRKPYDFEGSTLTDAVYWLLTQCGGIDQYYRAKCMELVVKLSKHITNCDSAKAMINNYINTHGIETFNAIILKGLKSKIDSLSFKAIAPLLRSLDCYIWLIRNDLLTVQYLFANSNSEREVIFNCARNFIHVVNQIKIETKDDDSVMLSKELEELQILHYFFLNKDLFELIAKCIMCPEVIGFDTKNFEISEALPLVMENLLKSIIRKNDDTLLSRVKHELSVHVEKHTNNFIDMDNIVFGKESCNELKQYVRGLSFLEQHDIFNRLYNGTQLIDHPEDKIGCIFKVLAQKRMDVFVCVNIKAPVKDYLRILIELLLIHYEPTITRTLITLITTNTILGSDLNKIEHGIYFLNMFKNEIFRYMLKDIEKTIEVFDDLLQANPPFLLTITEQVFVFVQRHKNELHECKQKLISIYGIAVHLKDKPTEVLSLSKDFYTWILNQLTESSDIEYKIKILQNFLVCLTDMTCNTRPELLVILHTLRSHRLDMCPNDFAQRNVKALKIINCFQTLLKLLAVTKSVVLFKTIILFTAGIAEQLCNETTDEYLRKYFNSITTEYALESIETAYKLFMNSNTSIDERFDILRKFLLPLFHLSKIHEICKFFERNIKEIYTIVQQVLIGSSSDMKQLIVSKIGCYDLVAVMFGKIPLKEIDNPESVITRNAIDNVVTGKELLRNLYRSALNVRMLKTPDPEHKEIIRLLHCSAYNCSIAIVSLKTDEDSYLSIFLENRKKKQLIWENIVDCRKQYNLQQTFKEYPKYRKKLTTIRKSMRSRQSSARYSYIYSYNVGTCTLNEDINAYDFNEATVRNNSNNADTAEESMSLLFESDELNNHECMGYICGVLNHMISEEISTLPDDSNIVMPEWLKYFCKSMTSTSYDNVRLFMLKIILNTQTVFKPYAKFFLQPIIHTTYSYLRQNQLNYVIADVIEMLIDWRTVAVPDENHGKTMAQKLWEIIIEKAMGAIIDKIQSIFRQMQTTFVSRQIKCIRALCKSYQNAGMIYFEFVTANIFRVDRMGQSHCLEIFLQCIPKLGVDLILKELAHMKFRDLLRNKVSLCEKIALQIIDSLVPILPPSNFLPLLNLVPLYTKHDSSEYRECAYDIFMNVYKRYSIDTSDDENVRELVYNSREMLLSGILEVIPLSKTVGLIQWIDDTRSLEDLIHFTLSEEQIKKYKLICKDYDKWIRSAAPSKNQIQRYKEATVKYSASKVSAKMNEFISKTEWDSLRKTFTVLCPSVESFLTMRRNFITTYATMCIAHWILGIGDRHFRNILITIGSGHCLGIDFGLAFDAGVDLRIPELVPFRLTHQILGLLKPFTEKDLLGAIMIHTLRALRNESGPILSCMDVFVHEPLNWTDNVNKALREDEDDIADVKWIPMKKIKAIECLLDQATDLNILGRSYVGWQPWL
ncbi:DNA-dependent protein kinase catalytic subunit, partial [Dufourea novaeangliae]